MGKASGLYLLLALMAWPLLLQAQSPALDSKQPIEITADELEVQQPQQRAIFSGNVLARQGGITMKSQRMIVYYDSAQGGGQDDGAKNSISRIEADGGVFFASANETAQGSRAVYEVAKEQIRMMGNVTLTRDKSVVKGAGLVYNLQSGRSILSSGPASGGQPGERVRGVFVPGEGQ